MAIGLPGSVQVYVSATNLAPELLDLIKAQLRDPAVVVAEWSTATIEAALTPTTYKQRLVPVPTTADLRQRLELLQPALSVVSGKTIIFVKDPPSASAVVRSVQSLSPETYEVDEYHSSRTLAQREQTMKAFKDGNLTVLVATSSSARSLVYSNVAHVILFDFPASESDYYTCRHHLKRLDNGSTMTGFYMPSSNGKIASLLLESLRNSKQVCSVPFVVSIRFLSKLYKCR